MSRDPLVIARSATTTNPYAFAFNDPVNFSDPTGLTPFGVCATSHGGTCGGMQPQDNTSWIGPAVAGLAWLFKAILSDNDSNGRSGPALLPKADIHAIRTTDDVIRMLPRRMQFDYGMAKGAWKMLEGANTLGALISSSPFSWPEKLQTARGMHYAATHLPQTRDAIVTGVVSRARAVASDDPVAVGETTFDVASFFFGGTAPNALRATRALPAARQIEVAWGASTYRHGGLMTGMEHIMYRHSAGSGFANVSRFAKGTTARNIRGYVDEAIRYGSVTQTGPSAFMVEYALGRTIGTNIAGEAASSIRVFVRDGIIQTAFPF